MKRTHILYIIVLLIALLTAGDALGAKPKKQQRRTRAKSKDHEGGEKEVEGKNKDQSQIEDKGGTCCCT